MFDIYKILSNLKLKRPVFCSEADFQHSFAWEAHLLYPNAKVYLEYNNPIIPQKMYIDLWFVIDGKNYAIELKYKTRKLDLVKEFGFLLGEQSSQDTSRYDYLKDMERL